jgi:hypothetical protein
VTFAPPIIPGAQGYPLALTGAVAATRYVGGTATGAPVAGTFEKGDLAVAQDGGLWVCTTAGSPGTWTAASGATPTLAAVLAVGNAASAKITTLTAGTASTDATNLTQVTTGVGGVMWSTVVAAGDQSISSQTTPQNDAELFFTAVSGGVYDIELDFIYGSPAGAGTPDLKTIAAEDGTARGVQHWLGFNTADAAADFVVLSSTASAGGWGTAAANRMLKMWGHHVGNGGTFQVQWSQNTSGVNATIRRAGSTLRFRRIV